SLVASWAFLVWREEQLLDEAGCADLVLAHQFIHAAFLLLFRTLPGVGVKLPTYCRDVFRGFHLLPKIPDIANRPGAFGVPSADEEIAGQPGIIRNVVH